jgi:ABC-2 type transport system ATP-binding protein
VLGVVAQQIALYQNLTARENLEFFGALYGVRGARLSARVKACLHDVHLSDRASSVVHNLSGGMQRRLHVASSLVHEPRLVILDEPSVGLDVESRQHLWALVRKLQAQGSAVLLTTHLLEEAEALCSRVAILRNGHIVAEGTPEALRARIPAVEIAFVQSPALTDIVEAARKNGLQTRPFETGVAIWLDRKMELREVIELFGNLPVDSLSRRPVTLEDAYTELSRTEH